MIWEPDPVLLHLGPLQIRYYGLIYAIALMGGFYIWRWQMLRGGHEEEKAERFLTLGVIAVLGGARLGHVFFYHPKRYLADPISILKIWEGGLASHGATVGLIIALIYFAWKYKVHIAEVFDRFAMSAAWGAILIRVGNFMNSEIVGRKTDLPWGVKFPRHDRRFQADLPIEDVPIRHPSQLYEVILGIIVIAILWFVDRRYKEERPRGILGALFFLTYFTGRFTVEFFKDFQTLKADRSALTMGQYLSLPFIALGAIWLWRVLKRPTPTHPDKPVAEAA